MVCFSRLLSPPLLRPFFEERQIGFKGELATMTNPEAQALAARLTRLCAPEKALSGYDFRRSSIEARCRALCTGKNAPGDWRYDKVMLSSATEVVLHEELIEKQFSFVEIFR